MREAISGYTLALSAMEEVAFQTRAGLATEGEIAVQALVHACQLQVLNLGAGKYDLSFFLPKVEAKATATRLPGFLGNTEYSVQLLSIQEET